MLAIHKQRYPCKYRNASTIDYTSRRSKQINHICDFCFKIFKAARTYESHYRTHFGFLCGINKCRYIFQSSFSVYKHKERRHPEFINTSSSPADMQALQFECYICKECVPTQKSLESHLSCHQIRTPCDICGQVFVSIKRMAAHKLVHKTLSSVAPDVIAINPIKSADGKLIYRYQCTICEKYLVRQRYALKHLKRHEKKVKAQLQCDICKMTFVSKVNVIRHMVKFHGSAPSKSTHFCELCGKGFPDKKGYHTHMYRHKNSTPKYICTLCGRGFTSLALLNVHTNSHNGVKPYNCKECGKAFVRTGQLNVHMRIHTGIKPYICSEEGCDRAYAHSVDLKRHLWGQHKIYTKKFPCQICGKIFPENKILTKHLKNHP